MQDSTKKKSGENGIAIENTGGTDYDVVRKCLSEVGTVQLRC